MWHANVTVNMARVKIY